MVVASKADWSFARASAFGRRAARAALVFAVLSPLTACGTDLGECDETKLGGSLLPPQMTHEGQRIVGASCAGGKCHSESATGETRFGAPAELNFDVLAQNNSPAELAIVGRGSTNVIDWADEMWEQIEAGTMPPPKPNGPGELMPAQREAVRNWLACGAEVITPTTIPVQATWDSIWGRLSSATCVSCHASAGAAGGNFVLGAAEDMCGAYARVFQATTIANPCAMEAPTAQLVVPNDPDNSLFLQKLKGTQICGEAMPFPGTTPYVDTAADVVAAIEMWIAMGAPKPASCP